MAVVTYSTWSAYHFGHQDPVVQKICIMGKGQTFLNTQLQNTTEHMSRASTKLAYAVFYW